MKNLLKIIGFLIVIQGCNPVENQQKLPVYGNAKVEERIVDGETVYDTIPHSIQYFRLFSQDSAVITPESLNDKIYVADFFFTSCPSICPIMKTQMLRVYEEFKASDQLMIVSHTIDPEYDTVQLLSDYAKRLGVSSDKWLFLTGDKDEIYNLGENSYMVVTSEDEDAPGGYIHSGAFILVDTKKRVRGVYDGTVPEQVDILMKDIRRLLQETQKEVAS